MRYYPLLLDLKGKKCVVIGGGEVAQRKAQSLLKAGATVYVISKTLSNALRKLKKKQRIFSLKSGYQKKYLKDAFLVIAATSDQKINRRAACDAQALGILTNVVDSPHLSSFIVPSIICKGDLIIGISTNGKAPALSKRIRKDLNKLLIPSYAKFLETLKDIRKDLKQRCAKPNLRRAIMNYLVNQDRGRPTSAMIADVGRLTSS